jgi:iron complex transport system substrate-binding protein
LSPLAAPRPRVVGLEWLDPIMVAGNWMPEMIALAGGVCHLTEAGRHSPYVPWPTVVAEDPEVIIVMPCGFDLERTLAEAALLPRLPGWHDISAVRADRVYAVDGNAYFNRSGPRMVDSLEILAHLIHPDVFPPPGDRTAFARMP